MSLSALDKKDYQLQHHTTHLHQHLVLRWSVRRRATTLIPVATPRTSGAFKNCAPVGTHEPLAWRGLAQSSMSGGDSGLDRAKQLNEIHHPKLLLKTINKVIYSRLSMGSPPQSHSTFSMILCIGQFHQHISSNRAMVVSSKRKRTKRAGLPATTAYGGTSFDTTE